MIANSAASPPASGVAHHIRQGGDRPRDSLLPLLLRVRCNGHFAELSGKWQISTLSGETTSQVYRLDSQVTLLSLQLL
jgi:hypothetical protein